MNQRTIGYLLNLIVYLIVTILSIILFIYLSYELWLNILIADVISTIFVFICSLIFKTSSMYDAYWSVYPMIVVTYIAIMNKFSNYYIFFFISIMFWGIRLTANCMYTFTSLKYEDWRYRLLKEKTKIFYPIVNFLGIHLFPTVVVYLCMLPFILNKGNPNVILLVISFILSIVAITLELVADIQMQNYRKNKNTPFIRNGIWKYSRHPNYLGEILFWWAIFLMGISYHNKILTIIGTVANTLLFLFISIPLADKRQSRKTGFDVYKKNTWALLPIYKKKVN